MAPQLKHILTPPLNKTKWKSGINETHPLTASPGRFPIDPKGAVIGEEVSLFHLFSQCKKVSIFPQLFCRLFS